MSRKDRGIQNPAQEQPNINNNFNYYHEYCRLYLANIVLTSQMKQMIAERYDLIAKQDKVEVTKLTFMHVQQKKVEDILEGNSDMSKNRRARRKANQIERHYRCPVETCQKSYGSEGSLNQHIKNKHRELYLTMPHIHTDSRPQDDKLTSEDRNQENEDQSYSHQSQQEQQSNLLKLERPYN